MGSPPTSATSRIPDAECEYVRRVEPFIFHQANTRFIERVVKGLDIASAAYHSNVEGYGNLSSPERDVPGG